MRTFVAGILFALIVGAIVVAIAVQKGYVPAAADNPSPSGMERWAARTSLNATIQRETANLKSPLQPDEATLAAGVKLYADNCVVCHGASDAKPSLLAQGLYIHAPMLAKRGVEDDPVAESYWKIAHGIRYTAMPAFGKTLSDDDLWRVSLFVANMNKLPATVQAKWKAVASVGAVGISGEVLGPGNGPPPPGSQPGAATSAPTDAASPGATDATPTPSDDASTSAPASESPSDAPSPSDSASPNDSNGDNIH